EATATTVEASAAMEAAAAKAFMVESATSKAVMVPAACAEAAPAIVIPVAVPTAAVPAGMAIIPVIPRPYADEHAVDKPRGAIVAIGRASVWVIVIVSIGTNRRWANVSRTIGRCANSQAHNHSLTVRERSAKEANAE